ncbi:MAG TPA: Crp/Fnr family transcriptional regulator [Clostridiales bacterium]|nr:Crp/Fnr family transcriptional regulator [Clostridiales bacterium]
MMMNEFVCDLVRTRLFLGLEPGEITELLLCVQARHLKYAKGERIISAGDRVTSFAIVLSGRGKVIQADAAGRQIIIALLSQGSEIGILIAASREQISPVTVQTEEPVELLSIPLDGVLGNSAQNCPGYDRLLRNCVAMIAEKGLDLHDRIGVLLKPTVREKILAYLNQVAGEIGSRSFQIPLDRSGLAEYLNIDRSALSRELSRMKRDGLLSYRKNTFTLF